MLRSKTGLLILSHLLSWLAVAYLFFTKGNSGQKQDVITVERVNIVNDDGTLVMAISNKQRIAAPRIDGKEYPVDMIERQHFAGMIFFNENGDEVGGLIFNSNELPDGRKYGSGHLSFDRYRDNQVVNLEYQENIHGLVKSGLTIHDRTGSGAFARNLDLLKEYKYDSITAERKQEIIQEIKALKHTGKLGAERLFLGSQNEIPQLIMKDRSGRKRVRLFIDSTDVAKLQFLDESGNVLQEFPKRTEENLKEL